jgi:hypothetical protein
VTKLPSVATLVALAKKDEVVNFEGSCDLRGMCHYEYLTPAISNAPQHAS